MKYDAKTTDTINHLRQEVIDAALEWLWVRDRANAHKPMTAEWYFAKGKAVAAEQRMTNRHEEFRKFLQSINPSGSGDGSLDEGVVS